MKPWNQTTTLLINSRDRKIGFIMSTDWKTRLRTIEDNIREMRKLLYLWGLLLKHNSFLQFPARKKKSIGFWYQFEQTTDCSDNCCCKEGGDISTFEIHWVPHTGVSPWLTSMDVCQGKAKLESSYSGYNGSGRDEKLILSLKTRSQLREEQGSNTAAVIILVLR